MKISTKTIVLIALGLVMLLCFVSQPAEAKPTCDSCLKAGYPYLCKATISDGKCFQNAGDVSCDGNGCVCCRKTATSGCQSCEDDDEPEEDDDDEV